MGRDRGRAAALARTGLVIKSPLGDYDIPAPRTVIAEALDRPFDPRPTEARALALPAQDRPAMAEGRSWAGIRGGNRHQDAVVQGIGRRNKTYSRATEHLVPADAAIARLRHLLRETARRLEAGEAPLGLGDGYDYRRITAASAVIDADSDWQDLVAGNAGIRDAAPSPAKA